MANLVKYGDWSDEQAKIDAEAARAPSEFLEALAEGDTTLRFLPPKVGKKSPFVVSYVHWVVRQTDGQRFPVNCPRMMASAPCPVCQQMDTLRASKSPADNAKAKKLFPKARICANVIDRDAEDKGVQVFRFGKMIYEGLMRVRNNPKLGGRFTDPEQGRDIIITRKGKGQQDTEYSVAAALEKSPAAADPGQFDEWMDAAYDLDQFLHVDDAAEIIRKIKGEDSEEPPARPARGAARGQSASDDAITFDPNEFEQT